MGGCPVAPDSGDLLKTLGLYDTVPVQCVDTSALKVRGSPLAFLPDAACQSDPISGRVTHSSRAGRGVVREFREMADAGRVAPDLMLASRKLNTEPEPPTKEIVRRRS